jgi:hypothetical protein
LLNALTNLKNPIMKKMKFMAMVVLAGVMMSTLIYAQKDKSKRPSPPAMATGKVGGATISIDYSSPSVKGRKIWGALIPYGKPWRAGANEATIFQTDRDLKIEGKTLAAGKYSLFATPNEKEWEFIFNSETGQWGENDNGGANFNPAKNVITVKAKPTKSSTSTEKLAYEITPNGFVFRWENLQVPVGIK